MKRMVARLRMCHIGANVIYVHSGVGCVMLSTTPNTKRKLHGPSNGWSLRACAASAGGNFLSVAVGLTVTLDIAAAAAPTPSSPDESLFSAALEVLAPDMAPAAHNAGVSRELTYFPHNTDQLAIQLVRRMCNLPESKHLLQMRFCAPERDDAR
jgi:hypothetical protein